MSRIATLLAFSLMLWALPAQADVSATLDRNPVAEGESVMLTIRVVDVKGEPDLAPLEADFRVLSQSTNSQVRFVNGEVSRWKDWNIQLLPKRSGRLLIPALSVGQEQSQAFYLQVNKQAQQGPRQAWVEFSAEPKTVWQGQQVLLTVQLYYAASVRSGELSLPSVSNAVIEQLGDDLTEQTIKNGVRYNRLSRRYVVFPEQAGEFVIGAPVFTGQIETSRQPSRSFGGLFRNTRQISAAGEDIRLTVNAAEVGGEFWLPAQDLALTAEWAEQRSEFRVGEPVTRIVTLTAYGLLATQLPDLEFDYPGLRSYPEAVEQNSQGSAQGVVGTRRYRSAIIPQQPGAYTLPEQRLKWWDVARGQWAEAILPAEKITVLPAAGGPAMNNEAPCEPLLALPPKPAINAASDDDAELAACGDEPAPTLVASTFWKVLSAALAVVWLITLVLWLWSARGRQPKQARPEAEIKLSAAKKALIKAARKNQLQASVKALSELADLAGLAASAPAAVAAQVADEALKTALLDLDQAYYRGQNVWSGNDLATALESSDWPPEPRKNSSASALPPMYPPL